MDNAYIQKNVLPALTEALSAMATQSPDDKVEFIGKYLLSYVDRRQAKDIKGKETVEAEAKLSEYLKQEKAKEAAVEEKNFPIAYITTQYERLLDAIPTKSTKQEALYSVVEFLENVMHIPSAYIAFKSTVGESEVLNYLTAGPTSQHVMGKKLPKPIIDEGAEEIPERLGVSFEAFKIPEVPEGEEEPAAEEGEEAPVKKGPPPLSNLIIPNAMRDKRVKFYGIPKLGAFAACPFTFSSFEHEGVSTYTPADGETPAAFTLTPREQQFLIAFDSVGKYRQFTAEEIARVVALGNKLIELFQRLESKLTDKHLAFLQSEALKGWNDAVTDFAAKVPGEEAAALEAHAVEVAAQQAAAAASAGEGAEPPAPAEGAELLKARTDAALALHTWSKVLANSPAGKQLSLLQQYLFPLPGPALKLLYVIALLINTPASSMQDVCGDISWDAMKSVVLERFVSNMEMYNPTQSIVLSGKENTFAFIKSYVEANNLLDAAVYPVFLSVFPLAFLPWLQKALAAREAAFTYSNEVDKIPLERID